MTVLLTLIRHAPTDWNLSGRIQGRSDIALSSAGARHVRTLKLPQWLHQADWWTSPLIRARETARLLGIGNAKVDLRLTEMDWGEWEGQCLTELRQTLGPVMQANEQRGLDFRPPGGESPREVQKRMQSFLADISHGPPVSAAITHKGVIRALYAAACGWDMTEKPPIRMDWSKAQVFRIGSGAAIRPYRLNLALDRTVP